MDGFDASDNIFVVAATNLLQNLDQALLRPGRFDYKIKIELPDPVSRFQILKIHLKNKQHNLQNIDISRAATMMDGWNGAEIQNIVNLAALDVVR